MGRNVVIPQSLLERLIELLDSLDADRYGYNFCCEYEYVFQELKMKMRSIELRKAYGRVFPAENRENRARARFQCLCLRRIPGKAGMRACWPREQLRDIPNDF